MKNLLTRRQFIQQSAAVGWALRLSPVLTSESVQQAEPLQPIGEAKGIHPGRVVWVHDPMATDWRGPGDGRWYEDSRTKQERIDEMMDRAVCELTGQPTVGKTWDGLIRHLNQARGKGPVGYKPGEKLVIKPNWVGMIFREGAVNPETYMLVKRQDYMNTAPQMINALLRQLVSIGVAESDITVCDTLAYIVHEYYEPISKRHPAVRFVDHAGKFGRIEAKPSSVPLYWSCRPEGKKPDFVPSCFAEAEYQVNFANFKAHGATGVTLCGKNHFGSLIRWPVETGYQDIHRNAFLKQTKVYREQVDLMGHGHFGGKTVLYLIDGLFSGIHPDDQAPRKFNLPPFNGNWTASLFASQDPVAIDSVAFDFLSAELPGPPEQTGVDDYLHEAALASDPPSGTFYDPDHAKPEKRLPSLGVHEHWNNHQDKKYSRNLGAGKGIELVALKQG